MRSVYIASCAHEGGILRCLLDDSGRLHPRESVFLDRPMYMAMEKGLLHVLLRAPFPDSDSSALVSIPLGTGGTMGSPGAARPVPGRVSAHLSPGHKGIYTANYISGDISLLPGRSVFHGKGAHPHYIAPAPDGEFIAVADLGTDSIYTYSPGLEPVHRLSLPPGSGCRHLCFSPDGHYAYCANEISSTVSILAYDRGRFSLIDTVPALPENWEGFNAAAAIRCDEHSLWISHRGYDHISRFRRRAAQLLPDGQIPCGGRWPRDFILLSPFIVCANEKSDTVTVIENDMPVFSLPVKCPVALISD